MSRYEAKTLVPRLAQKVEEFHEIEISLLIRNPAAGPPGNG
jgi:hypothetical protein